MEASKLDISGINESKLTFKRKYELRLKVVQDYLSEESGKIITQSEWAKLLNFKNSANAGAFMRQLERKHKVIVHYVNDSSPKSGKIYSLAGHDLTRQLPVQSIPIQAISLEEVEKMAAQYTWTTPEPELNAKTINRHTDLRQFINFLRGQYLT